MSSVHARIHGAWDLVSYTGININDPSDIIYPMGQNAKGQILYTNDGYMAALLQVGNLAPWQSDWKNGSTEELANAARGTMAYGGPFYVDEEPGRPLKIVHHVQISMHPTLTNTLQIRCAELVEENGRDYIILGPESPTEWNGVQRLLRLKWQKRPENHATQPPANTRELKL
jgi:hypothetical protein